MEISRIPGPPQKYLNQLPKIKYVALSGKHESRQAVSNAAQAYNRIGEQCRKQGFQLLYYNHNWEFERFDGKYVIELLMEETDPEWVKFEPDVYWIKRGGEDPAEFLRKLAGRCPLVHIKDMEPGEEQFFAEIGEGIIDFQQVADRAKEAGAEWLVVEQDRCRRPPLESIAISLRNMQKLGLA